MRWIVSLQNCGRDGTTLLEAPFAPRPLVPLMAGPWPFAAVRLRPGTAPCPCRSWYAGFTARELQLTVDGENHPQYRQPRSNPKRKSGKRSVRLRMDRQPAWRVAELSARDQNRAGLLGCALPLVDNDDLLGGVERAEMRVQALERLAAVVKFRVAADSVICFNAGGSRTAA